MKETMVVMPKLEKSPPEDSSSFSIKKASNRLAS
jgi:hypothetical protein